MKAIVHDSYDAHALELRDVDKPAIAEDQVLVRVHASSVNPVEVVSRAETRLRTNRGRAAQTQEWLTP